MENSKQMYFQPDFGAAIKVAGDVVAGLVKRAARAGAVFEVDGLKVVRVATVGQTRHTPAEAVAALQAALGIQHRKTRWGNPASQTISPA